MALNKVKSIVNTNEGSVVTTSNGIYICNEVVFDHMNSSVKLYTVNLSGNRDKDVNTRDVLVWSS